MSCICAVPFAPACEPGWENILGSIVPFSNDATKELINFSMPSGQTLTTVPLAINKTSNNMIIFGPPTLTNKVDATVLNITYTVILYSTSSIVVECSAAPDTANYKLQGILIVTS